MRASVKEGDERPVKKDRDKVQAVRARQRALGRELRRMYDEVVQEPIPEEFVDLLRQIDQTDGKNPKKGETR